MTHQETIHALKRRFKKIKASFDATITYFDAEEIHAFRVEIKKLRAFLHLTSIGDKIKHSARLHLFYHIVGEICNLQLQKQRVRDVFLHQSDLPHTYLTLLTIEIAATIRRAREFAANRLFIIEEEQHLVGSFPNYLPENNSIVFAESIVHQLEHLSENDNPPNDEVLHSVRKHLKDLLYNYSYIEKEALCILPPMLSHGKETISELTHLLGQFLDLRSGVALLQPIYIDQVFDARERENLIRLRVNWEKEAATIKNQALRALLPIQQSPEYALRYQ